MWDCWERKANENCDTPNSPPPSPAHSRRPLRGLEQKSLKHCAPLSARISSPLLVLWILFSSSLASFRFSSSTWTFFLTSSSDCFSSRTIAFTLWVTPCSLSVSPVTVRNACCKESGNAPGNRASSLSHGILQPALALADHMPQLLSVFKPGCVTALTVKHGLKISQWNELTILILFNILYSHPKIKPKQSLSENLLYREHSARQHKRKMRKSRRWILLPPARGIIQFSAMGQEPECRSALGEGIYWSGKNKYLGFHPFLTLWPE